MTVTNWLPQQHILGLPLFGNEKNITWALWPETKKWPAQTKSMTFLHRWRTLSEFQGRCSGKNKWREDTEKEEAMQERHSDICTIVTGSAMERGWMRHNGEQVGAVAQPRTVEMCGVLIFHKELLNSTNIQLRSQDHDNCTCTRPPASSEENIWATNLTRYPNKIKHGVIQYSIHFSSNVASQCAEHNQNYDIG